tara:strand:- start:1164 stop:2573 length:1410 start_codon:yes stop_codon:yes gene_type:complete
MLRISAIFLMLAAVFSPASAGELDDFVAMQMEESALPGVAWAVVDGDDVTTGARGVTTKGGDVPVTGETRFLLGSISKSFTALAIMQLAEAGALDINQPVARYLGDFANKPAGDITLRQLLGHTSGYSTLQGNGAPEKSEALPDAIARRAAWYAQQEPAYPPGSRWEYSNANYLILGRVIEAASGMRYPDYIASNIFRPLGMEDSYVSDGEPRGRLAEGHVPWFGSMRATEAKWSGLGSAPQGGIVSTASDLARYLQTMMNGQDDILSAAGKSRMLEPASEASPGYGFGWMLDAEDASAYHTGLSPGFETIAAMLPAKKRGVVVLTNGGSGMGFAETTQLRYGLVARALDLPPPGDTGRGMRIVNFLTLAAAPIIFLLAIVWAWAKRGSLRAKRASAFGQFSLWFPLLATAGVAWACVCMIPNLFGVSLATLRLFQPDMTLLLQATAILGLVWAVVRLAIAYRGPNPVG